ncbi:MAG: hypothetical protein H6735_29980 [Alphaproteobacteria bacterium]|nr:hypothetical protein [Alphaproteobacteria bacterium]
MPPAVAIIGIGCRFPGGSSSAEAFWKNIASTSATRSARSRATADLEAVGTPTRAVLDKTPPRSIGGFTTDFRF